jgi:hypothetical protein
MATVAGLDDEMHAARQGPLEANEIDPQIGAEGARGNRCRARRRARPLRRCPACAIELEGKSSIRVSSSSVEGSGLAVTKVRRTARSARLVMRSWHPSLTNLA